MRFLGLLCCGMTATVAASHANCADGSADCLGFTSLTDAPPVTLGRVSGHDPRRYFIRNGTSQHGCPSDNASCRDRAFVVPGDTVLLSTHRNGFVCADYIGAKGADRAGWLKDTGIEPQPVPAITTADWTGRWVRTEASITITPARGKAGAVAVKGDATFGSLDPDRVKRGGVNMGSISGVTSPDGDMLRFAMGDQDTTLPVDKGDEFSCKVWMRRLGPYLLVDDNNNCGGLNVSFRGAYSKAP